MDREQGGVALFPPLLLPWIVSTTALQLLADIWCLRQARDAPEETAAAVLRTAIIAMLIPLVVVLLTAEPFAAMTLWAHGIFLHFPLLAAGLLAQRRSRTTWSLAALASVLTVIALDAFVLEPPALEVNHHRIEHPDVTVPVRLAVLSDIQTDHPGEYERGALRAALAAKPDLILLPGDYVQHEDPAVYDELARQLSRLIREEGLAAPLGVYAVRGNVDPAARWEAVFEGTGVEAWTATRRHDLAGLTLTALSFRDGFDPELVLPDPGGLHIAFAHGPDFALGDIGADLLVAGHTHGGQVQLPLIGPVITYSEVPRAWASGLTKIAPERWLLVSRGVGMERGMAPRLRFGCRPEVVIVDLVPPGGDAG